MDKPNVFRNSSLYLQGNNQLSNDIGNAQLLSNSNSVEIEQNASGFQSQIHNYNNESLNNPFQQQDDVGTPNFQANVNESNNVSVTQDATSVAAPNVRKSRKKLCVYEGCGKQCSFNYEWESKARYCSTHKLIDMVDVKHKTCEIQGCSKQPYFNYESIRKGRFCASHKLYNMVNVKNKSCQAVGCVTQPSFNYSGRKSGVYCSIHKLKDMVNVKNKVCMVPDCLRVPLYNCKGASKPLYCVKHKKESMVDVSTAQCEASGCDEESSCNFEGHVECRFCTTHQLTGMRVLCNTCKNLANRMALNQRSREEFQGQSSESTGAPSTYIQNNGDESHEDDQEFEHKTKKQRN